MPPSNTNTEIALMKKDIEYIKESISEQKDQHKALYDMMKNFIESSPDKFVTKDELKPIKEKQVFHDEVISRIAWASFWWFIAIIWAFIWITKFM